MGITAHESKAVLALREHFNADPIVFDIGSNKGGWADILIENVGEMHLFEPNLLLLHYTQVKYDYLENVFYRNVAIFKEEGQANFYYFTNINNGLSSLYKNPKWEHLPMKQTICDTITLDSYWPSDKVIDFVKIDVEGADYDVLVGATHLLKQKQIKFIQIEFSEHYKLAGRTFQDVITFIRKFGYEVYNFDGYWFEPLTDSPEMYGSENFYIMAEYTQNWNSEFKKNTALIGKVQTVLEVGCFEGLTTNYICDNLLKEDGRIICIDPLTDEYLPGHKDNEMFKGQYDRFIRNTSGRPVQLIRKKSQEALAEIKDLRFGLIYIDGDHTENGVFQDAVMYWNLLLDTKNAGGYMLFDDYGQSPETARGIDRFLETQTGNFILLVKEYQVLIRRIQ